MENIRQSDQKTKKKSGASEKRKSSQKKEKILSITEVKTKKTRSNLAVSDKQSEEIFTQRYKSDIPEVRKELSPKSSRVSTLPIKEKVSSVHRSSSLKERKSKSKEKSHGKKESKSDKELRKKEKKISRRQDSDIMEKKFRNRKITYSDGLAIPSVPFKDLFSKVPKPKESVIENGLPSWNSSPLDAKLTIIPSPENEFVCTRGKVGERLWKSYDGAEFVFYDPYGYEVSIPYEPVHDKHLQRFFQNPYNVINLKKLGLVTERDDAKCTLKEYNSYRKYLYKIYAESLRNVFYAKMHREMEERQVQKALMRTKKEIEKQLKYEFIMKRQKIVEAQREEIRCKQENKCMRRLSRVQEVLKNIERKKEENIREAEKRHQEFKDRIQQKVIVAAELEAQRKIDALLQRQEDDHQFELSREEDHLKKKMEKETKIQERWERKIRNQNFSIEREKLLREKRANGLHINAQKRLRLNKRQLKHREEELGKLKQEQGYEREKKYLKSKRIKVCFKQEIKEIFPRIPQTIVKLVERFRRAQMFEDITRTELYEKVLPYEVKEALDTVLNEAIKINIKRQVESFVKKLITESFILFDNETINWRASQFPILVGKRQSLLVELSCIPDSEESHFEPNILDFSLFQEEEDKTVIRLVSFGDVETVEHVETAEHDVKCVKEREPTPVPSQEDLLAVGFEQSLNYSDHSEKLPQKRLLKELIDCMNKAILTDLDSRIVSHFSDSGNIVSLSPADDLLDLELKESNLVDYISSTLVNVTETKEEIDEDECVHEVARYIAKHILSI